MTPLVINITAQNNTGPGTSAAAANLAGVATAAQAAGTGARTATASTFSLGAGLMQLSQFADDAQYGLRAVVNQIPGLMMGFGAGAGVAAGVQLAAVAFNWLSNNLGEAEKAMDKVAEKSRDAVHAAADRVKSAEAEAEAAARAAQAESELAGTVERLEAGYLALVRAQDESTAAAERQARASRIVRAALKEQALEQIRAEEAGGKITKEEAAVRRGQVEQGDAEAAEQERAAAAAKRKSDLESRARAALAEAAQLDRVASAAEKAQPMPEKERQLIEYQKAEAEAKLKDAARRQQEANARADEMSRTGIMPGSQTALNWFGDTALDADVSAEEQKAERARQEAEQESDRIKRIEKQVRADDALREQDAQKKAAELRKLAEQRRQEAARYTREAADTGAQDTAEQQAYTIRRTTLDMRTGTDAGAAKAAEVEAAAQAKEREDQERQRAEKADRKRAAAARKGLGGLGLNPAQLQAAEQQIEGYEKDSNEAGMLAFLGRVEGLMRSLARQGQKSREEYTKAMARIAELEAMFKNDRD